MNWIAEFVGGPKDGVEELMPEHGFPDRVEVVEPPIDLLLSMVWDKDNHLAYEGTKFEYQLEAKLVASYEHAMMTGNKGKLRYRCVNP